MKDRHITYSVANLQGEVFLQALEVVKRLPGDWHAGLNWAQSIFDVFYVGFLDEFQDLLKWNKTYKEVSKCYFNAVRLITFVFDEVVRFYVHQYVSQVAASEVDCHVEDDVYIAKVTIGLIKFLRGLKNSKDKWISTCGVFIEIAHDFLQFVNAYRVGDSIMVEYGYQKFLPVLKLIGHNKYVEIIYAQQETLYKSPFSSRVLAVSTVVRQVSRIVTANPNFKQPLPAKSAHLTA